MQVKYEAGLTAFILLGWSFVSSYILSTKEVDLTEEIVSSVPYLILCEVDLYFCNNENGSNLQIFYKYFFLVFWKDYFFGVRFPNFVYKLVITMQGSWSYEKTRGQVEFSVIL